MQAPSIPLQIRWINPSMEKEPARWWNRIRPEIRQDHSALVQCLQALLQLHGAVLTGCGVTATGDLTFAVASGTALVGGAEVEVAGATVTIGARDSSHPRLDTIYLNSAGAPYAAAGTASANPVEPGPTTLGDVRLAVILVQKAGA